MTAGHAALIFVSLLGIVNPLAIAPVFGALTRDEDAAQARRTALVAVLTGFALIAAAGLLGHWATRAFGAETALVHLLIALALSAMGLALLLGRGGFGASSGARRRNPALVPLAVPLIAGPGALGAMAMFAGRYRGETGALATLYGLLAATGVITYLAFRAAGPITRRLGARGLRRISQGLGLVLIGVGAKFLLESLHAYGLAAA